MPIKGLMCCPINKWSGRHSYSSNLKILLSIADDNTIVHILPSKDILIIIY